LLPHAPQFASADCSLFAGRILFRRIPAGAAALMPELQAQLARFTVMQRNHEEGVAVGKMKDLTRGV